MQRFCVAIAVILGASCGGGGETVPRAQGAFCPPECPASARGVTAAVPVGSAQVPADFGTAAGPAAPPDPNMWDPASVTLVLDDPRLAAAKAEVAKDAFGKAAEAVAAALEKLPAGDPARAAWLYQVGKLRALGGTPGPAAKAFQECAALGGPLADFAHLQAAQWLVGTGQHDAALAEAKLVGDDPALAPALDLVQADAHVGKGDVEGAASRFRAYLARENHPANWVTISLRYGGLLVAHPVNGGGSGRASAPSAPTPPSEARAEEAVRVVRKVIEESPGGSGSGQAKDLEKQALGSLPFDKRKRFEKPTSDELLARAKHLVASQQGKEALAVLSKALKLPRAQKPSEYACEVHVAEGDALKGLRKKAEAAEAYARADDACAGQSKRPEALYNHARMLAQAGRTVEAMRKYAELEKEFPKHRLADDARLKGALAALDANDEAKFADLVERMPDDYPDGDMVTDGLFALALARAAKGDWAKAIAPLEKALGRSPRERVYHSAGRLSYFLARAHIATGNAAQGEGELASVIQAQPLGFYMTLAYTRLADRNRAAADKALRDAVAHEPTGAFLLPRGKWLDDPAFQRALELVRAGDAKLAKGELDRIGLSARVAPREVLWAAAFLFAKAGSPTLSHALLRSANSSATARPGELTEWLDHYPVGAWQAPWQLAFPRPFQAVVAPAAAQNKLPEAWAHAIMREESAFDARAVSPAKAFGLMQLIVPTAKRMADPLGLASDDESLKRPEVNIPLGCRYLSFLRNMFPANPLLAIPGYNAGGNAPKKWLGERPSEDFDVWVERIPYEETRNYTKRVIVSLAAYEFLYARDQPSEALKMPVAAYPSPRGAPSAVSAIGDDGGGGAGP